MKEKRIFIGEAAKQVGINPKTIRYYEEINLLPVAKRSDNNYRIYNKDTLTILNFIIKAQGLGFTLRDINEILTIRNRGFTPCTHVHDLLKERIVAIDQKLTELKTIRSELKKLEYAWSKVKIVKENDTGICPQIEKVKFQPSKKFSRSLYYRKLGRS